MDAIASEEAGHVTVAQLWSLGGVGLDPFIVGFIIVGNYFYICRKRINKIYIMSIIIPYISILYILRP